MEKDAYPSFKEAFHVWVKVAILSFGGPANQIAVMHRLIVEEKKWVGEKRFLSALNYCMLLPGPEAHQLAIYIGWLLHRVRGGLVAGSLFVLPGFLSILLLSILYVKYQSTTFIATLFYGIKPAVIAIVLDALIRIGKKTIKTRATLVIALMAFIGIFFFNILFPFIVLSAALAGFLIGKINIKLLGISAAHVVDEDDLLINNTHLSTRSIFQTLLTIITWMIIWFSPIVFIVLFFGGDSIFTKESLFFSKVAVITFGGAYAVLSYIAQQAVQYYGWLKPGEMLDGLGMAETTPGPLIQVVQFIAFIAAYRFPEGLSPLMAGIFGSCIATWMTFVPSFLWIFAGAPYIEKLRKIASLNAAMTAITAAVVGVILNLSIWFAINTIFKTVNIAQYFVLHIHMPVWSSIDLGALFIMLIASIMIF